MSSLPTQTEPTSGRERRSNWAWLLVSLLLHVAVLVGLALLPERPPPAPDTQWADIEMIEIEPVEVDVDPELPTSPPEPVEPEPVAESESPSRPESPAPETPPPPPSPSEPSEAGGDGGVPQLDPTAQPDPGKSLALGGYRNQSQGSAQGERGAGVPAPVPRMPLQGPVEQRQQYGPERRFESGAPGPPVDDAPARSFGEAGFKRRASGKMVYRDPDWRFSAELESDGRLTFRDLPGKFKGMAGMSEAALKSSGQELYRKQKKALLDKTFELRMNLAVSHARRAMDRRLAALYRDLLELWQRESIPASQRRRTIFSRWDECEEAPAAVELEGEFAKQAGSELDQARTEAGKEARSKIEEFIRRHLPRGSPDAYTEAELRELNQGRRSEQRFDPYG